MTTSNALMIAPNQEGRFLDRVLDDAVASHLSLRTLREQLMREAIHLTIFRARQFNQKPSTDAMIFVSRSLANLASVALEASSESDRIRANSLLYRTSLSALVAETTRRVERIIDVTKKITKTSIVYGEMGGFEHAISYSKIRDPLELFTFSFEPSWNHDMWENGIFPLEHNQQLCDIEDDIQRKGLLVVLSRKWLPWEMYIRQARMIVHHTPLQYEDKQRYEIGCVFQSMACTIAASLVAEGKMRVVLTYDWIRKYGHCVQSPQFSIEASRAFQTYLVQKKAPRRDVAFLCAEAEEYFAWLSKIVRELKDPSPCYWPVDYLHIRPDKRKKMRSNKDMVSEAIDGDFTSEDCMNRIDIAGLEEAHVLRVVSTLRWISTDANHSHALLLELYKEFGRDVLRKAIQHMPAANITMAFVQGFAQEVEEYMRIGTRVILRRFIGTNEDAPFLHDVTPNDMLKVYELQKDVGSPVHVERVWQSLIPQPGIFDKITTEAGFSFDKTVVICTWLLRHMSQYRKELGQNVYWLVVFGGFERKNILEAFIRAMSYLRVAQRREICDALQIKEWAKHPEKWNQFCEMVFPKSKKVR